MKVTIAPKAAKYIKRVPCKCKAGGISWRRYIARHFTI